jgi:hypothetical protein
MISCLYTYTNPPPYRYGSRTPKAAESILRAYSFNRKADKDRKHEIILPGPDIQIERTHWEDSDGPYPFFEVTGNWHPGEMYLMCQNFLTKFHQETDTSAEEVMNMMNTNSDILTKKKANF